MDIKFFELYKKIGEFANNKWPNNLLQSLIHYIKVEADELKRATLALPSFNTPSDRDYHKETRMKVLEEAVDVFISLLAFLSHPKIDASAAEFISAIDKKLEILAERDYVDVGGKYLRQDKIGSVHTDKIVRDDLDDLDDDQYDLRKKLELDNFG